MDTTPPVYVFYPTWYQTTVKDSSAQDGQLSALIIFFIAFAALIALLIMLCLIVMIYNICRYGACCPPSGYGNCCAPCAIQPTDVQVVKPSPVFVQSSPYAVGSYIGRGNRLNQGTYLVEPRTIRAGTISSRRNSVIVVGQNTLPRRQVTQTVRPQIMISDSVRVPNIGRSSLLALPGCSSSSSQSVVRCFTRNEPFVCGGNLNNDGDVRVIVRNQPYAASQRGTIIEAPIDVASCISPPPAFDNLTIRKTGGMTFEGGGCGLLDQGVGGNYDYGFAGQHSATIDVCIDQVPDYTSDDGIQQFHQTAIYPSLSQSNFY